MDRPERRRDRRQGANFDVSFFKVGSTINEPYGGHTVNVGPGGLYVEATARTVEPGDILRIELLIPPTPGLLEFGGKIAAFAKVLRADHIGGDIAAGNSTYNEYGVALQFCERPKLCI